MLGGSIQEVGGTHAFRGTPTSKKGTIYAEKGHFLYQFVKSGGKAPPVPTSMNTRQHWMFSLTQSQMLQQ